MEVIEAVAQWAHDAGVPVMINPAPAAPMSDRLLACATYLSPNEHEAAILAGHSIDVSNGINMEDVAVVSQAFQARGWRTSSSPWGKTAPSRRGKTASITPTA